MHVSFKLPRMKSSCLLVRNSRPSQRRCSVTLLHQPYMSGDAGSIFSIECQVGAAQTVDLAHVARMLIGSIRPRQIVRPASSAIRPSLWTVTTAASITPNNYGASRLRDAEREESWCSSPTSSGCPPRPSARSTRAAGKSNCSLNLNPAVDTGHGGNLRPGLQP